VFDWKDVEKVWNRKQSSMLQSMVIFFFSRFFEVGREKGRNPPWLPVSVFGCIGSSSTAVLRPRLTNQYYGGRSTLT